MNTHNHQEHDMNDPDFTLDEINQQMEELDLSILLEQLVERLGHEVDPVSEICLPFPTIAWLVARAGLGNYLKGNTS